MNTAREKRGSDREDAAARAGSPPSPCEEDTPALMAALVGAAPTSFRSGARSPRVLLVEGDLAVRRRIDALLRAGAPEGLRLESAGRLSEALGKLAERGADAVVIDLTLPDACGLEAVVGLRSASPGVPLVALVDGLDEGLRARALEAGVEEVLAEAELDGPTLRRAVTYAIERRRLIGEIGRLSHEARKTHEAFVRLLAVSVDGAIVFDAEGAVVHLNREASRLLDRGLGVVPDVLASEPSVGGPALELDLPDEDERDLAANGTRSARRVEARAVAIRWLGHGARLVWLRTRKPHPSDDGTSKMATLSPPSLAPPVSSRGPLTSRRPRVLLIDDEAAILRAFFRLLDPQFEVVVARGGDDGLALLATDRAFDVVVCDMMMPGSDGQQVYETLRGTAPEMLERLVFCSGGVSTDDARHFLAGIPNVLLEKPVQPRLLREVVRATAERSRANR